MVFIKRLFTRYPITKGMLAYSLTWPIGCIMEQTIEGKTWETFDWKKCVKFSLYGSCYVAPILYGFIRITGKAFKRRTPATTAAKIVFEQLTFFPFNLASFFFVMSLVEGKSYEEAKQELFTKFWPVYMVGWPFWVTVNSLAYSLISERNRVPFVSLFGLMWSVFLAFKKSEGHHHGDHEEDESSIQMVVCTRERLLEIINNCDNKLTN